MMKSPIGVEIRSFDNKDGSKYLSADCDYDGEVCPFCGSADFNPGGSWTPGGCRYCKAVYHMGWVKEIGVSVLKRSKYGVPIWRVTYLTAFGAMTINETEEFYPAFTKFGAWLRFRLYHGGKLPSSYQVNYRFRDMKDDISLVYDIKG